MAPLAGGEGKGNKYDPGQQIGHIARDCSAVLSPLMDGGFVGDSDNYHYDSGFVFQCHLSSNDTNKSKSGYPVDIIVLSDNSVSWVLQLCNYFLERGFPSIVI